MKYFLIVIVGSTLTLISHKLVTIHRGYVAIGSEFLIIPLLMIMMYVANQVKDNIKEINKAFKEKEVKEWK